jgi:hypothetical protein
MSLSQPVSSLFERHCYIQSRAFIDEKFFYKIVKAVGFNFNSTILQVFTGLGGEKLVNIGRLAVFNRIAYYVIERHDSLNPI